MWPSVSGSLQDGSTQKKEKKGFFGHKDASKDGKKAARHKEPKQGRFSFKLKKSRASDKASAHSAIASGEPRIAGMPFAIPGEDSRPVADPPAAKPEYQQRQPVAPVVQNDLGYGITEVYGIPNLADRQATSGSLGSGKAPVTIPAYLKRIETGEVKSIDVTPFRIGRRRVEVDFHIADRLRVSRVHAIIAYESGSFFISDNASVNHTAVNGVQVKPFEKTALAHGDRISLGDEELLFLLG